MFLEAAWKRISNVLLERMLERTRDVLKGCKCNPTGSGRRRVALAQLATLCRSPSGFADASLC